MTPPPQIAPASVAAAGLAPASDLTERRRRKFYQLAALLVLSLVAGVLLAKSSAGKYDAAGPGTLDTNYTVETKTSSSGYVESVKYKVTYSFAVNGQQYTGKDTLYTEPVDLDTTVHYMAGNPKENGLTPNRTVLPNMIACCVAFLIATLAYGFLPKNQPFGQAVAGIGDSQFESAGMKRGKYSAWMYVHFAFFAQAGLIALLLALGLAAAMHTEATSYTVLGIATFVAIAVTLWVYADRWRCIETFASRSCSGVMNLSIFYVPVLAFVYANIRGLKKLQGR
jgi:hypothetical protein